MKSSQSTEQQTELTAELSQSSAKSLGCLGNLQLHSEVHQTQHNQLVKRDKEVILHLYSVFVRPFLEHSVVLALTTSVKFENP